MCCQVLLFYNNSISLSYFMKLNMTVISFTSNYWARIYYLLSLEHFKSNST
jgi:hypothetical protein